MPRSELAFAFLRKLEPACAHAMNVGIFLPAVQLTVLNNGQATAVGHGKAVAQWLKLRGNLCYLGRDQVHKGLSGARQCWHQSKGQPNECSILNGTCVGIKYSSLVQGPLLRYFLCTLRTYEIILTCNLQFVFAPQTQPLQHQHSLFAIIYSAAMPTRSTSPTRSRIYPVPHLSNLENALIAALAYILLLTIFATVLMLIDALADLACHICREV
jgi:hypothetical protein